MRFPRARPRPRHDRETTTIPQKHTGAGRKRHTARSLSSAITSLTDAQLTIFKELLSGDEVAAIAERLDRSPMTVNNHLREIFTAFDVHSRPKLMSLFIVRPEMPARKKRRAS